MVTISLKNFVSLKHRSYLCTYVNTHRYVSHDCNVSTLGFVGPQVQCDQIGRFIELWSTFQSLWHQLFCPIWPHFQAIFVKVSRSFIFLVESFLGEFSRHLVTFYWSHSLGFTQVYKNNIYAHALTSFRYCANGTTTIHTQAHVRSENLPKELV